MKLSRNSRNSQNSLTFKKKRLRLAALASLLIFCVLIKITPASFFFTIAILHAFGFPFERFCAILSHILLMIIKLFESILNLGLWPTIFIGIFGYAYLKEAFRYAMNLLN